MASTKISTKWKILLMVFIHLCFLSYLSTEQIEDEEEEEEEEEEESTTKIKSRSKIFWTSCNNSRLQVLNAECAFVSVPLDHRRPYGTKIRLALSRIKHDPSLGTYQGVILVNPGGPGNSGLSFISKAISVPSMVRGTYDWIGFDPRGVGSSQPSLSCIKDYLRGPRPNYNPVTQQIEKYWLNRSRHYVQKCEKTHSTLLKYMTSLDVVKDMNKIRHALGVRKINFYGYSYGTYLGQLYATVYPDCVRRMILDSNVDPRSLWFQANLKQNIAFERNMKRWFDWVARYNHVYHLGNKSCEVQSRWSKVLDQLKLKPISDIIGPAEWIDTFLAVTYYQSTWTSLATILSTLVIDKNSTHLLNWYAVFNKGSDDNSNAIYLSIICGDRQWPKVWDNVRNIYWRSFVRAPTFSWRNSWLNGPCQFWPRPRRIYKRINGTRTAGILLIGETRDAATPFDGNVEVRRRFPKARLIAVNNGINHANSLTTNFCVDDLVIKYLQSGQLPRRKSGDNPDVQCNATADPRPISFKKILSMTDIEKLSLRFFSPF